MTIENLTYLGLDHWFALHNTLEFSVFCKTRLTDEIWCSQKF